MGREIRMVPPNWDHPKDERYHDGRLLSMYDENFDAVCARWKQGFVDHKPSDHDGEEFWEYHGNPPDRKSYRPWKDQEATWFQLWETVSEGTPVSPPFATREELSDYLAKNGDEWDRRRGWGEDRAKAFVFGSGWAPTFIVSGGVMREGKLFVKRFR